MMDTIMRQSFFKHTVSAFVILILLLSPLSVGAQSGYEQRLERREKVWQKLIPNLYMLQYGGGIATVSAGLGWDYGRARQWETHILFGFVPKRYSHSHYWTFNIRQTYTPWSIPIKNIVSYRPLTASLLVNSILHNDFWMSEPDRYPHGYYGFSSRMRFHIAVGQRWTFAIPRDKRLISSQLSVYYELSTCDLYVRQKFLNSAIPFKDILSLGFGIIFTI